MAKELFKHEIEEITLKHTTITNALSSKLELMNKKVQ